MGIFIFGCTPTLKKSLPEKSPGQPRQPPQNTGSALIWRRDRRRISAAIGSAAKTTGSIPTEAPFYLKMKNSGHRLIEVFVNRGEYVITNAVYGLTDEIHPEALSGFEMYTLE